MEYTIGELVNERPYEVQVLALNEVGPSAAVSGSGVPAGVPDAPRNLVVTAGDEQLVVSWQAPENDHGAPVTAYQVQYRLVDDNNDDDDWVDVAGSVSPVTITGLADDESYQVRVQAKNATGWGPWVEGSGVPVGAPGLVGMLAVEALDGKLTVSWTAPEENGGATVTGYRVEYRVSRGTWTLYEITENLEVTIDSLTNGVSYQVQVRAENSAGGGPWANGSGRPVGPPGVPRSLVVTVGDKQLSLSWTAPEENGGATVTGYEVQYRLVDADNDDDDDWMDATDTVSPVVIRSLTNGESYQVQVQARNSAGEGPWVSGSGIPSGVPASVPTAPRNLVVTAGDKQLTVSWTAPQNNGGATITAYLVQYRLVDADGDDDDDWVDAARSASPVVIPSLANGESYEVRVQAENSAGEGAWISGSGSPVGPPGVPSGLVVTAGDKQLTVSWTAPQNNGGATITAYLVQYRLVDADGDDDDDWVDAARSASPVTIRSLTNGESYDVQVQARNSAGWGAWVSGSGSPVGPPGVPRSLVVTVGDKQLGLSWTVPEEDGGATVTGYRVEYRLVDADGDDDDDWVSVTDTVSPTTIRSLTNGESYDVQVQARNSAGWGAWVSGSGSPVGPPGVPRSLVVTVGDKQLGLSWTAPEENGGATVTGYEVQYRLVDADNDDDDWVDATDTVSPVVISSLANGESYQVQVRAKNSVGEGPWVSGSGIPAGVTASVPTAPRNLVVTAGDEQLTVSWTAPQSNGGSAITSYRVEYRLVDDDDDDWVNVTDTVSPTTISSLANGESYEVRVQAENSAGEGAWISGSGSPVGPPGAPTGLVVTAGDEQLTVSWTAPQDNGGSAITTYRVEYRLVDADNDDDDDWVDAAGSASPVTIRSLTNGESYDVQVQAENSAGGGAWISGSGSPVGPPGAPTGLVVTAGDEQLTVSWTAPQDNGGSAITTYRVEYRLVDADNDDDDDWVDAAGSASPVTIRSLTNGESYDVQVQAENSQGEGPWVSGSARPVGPPSVPRSLVVTVGDKQLGLSWTVPEEDGGATVTGYEVQYRLVDADGDDDDDWVDVADTVSPVTIRSLTNGESYDVQVRAKNSKGEGPWVSGSGIPAGVPVSVPTAPRNLVVTAGGEQLTVSWAAPQNNGGATITAYLVQYRLVDADSDDDDDWVDADESVSPVTIRSLANGESYEVRVQAENSAGGGAWISGSGSPVGPPDAPTGLVVTAGGEQLTVSWEPPQNNGGSAVTAYQVQYLPEGEDDWIDVPENVSPVVIDDLTDGVWYAVQVRARNSVGWSEAWASGSGRPVGRPSAPEMLVVTVGDKQLQVSWEPPLNDHGAEVTAYQVHYRRSGGVGWVPAGEVDDQVFEEEITGLVNGVLYQVIVAAENQEGLGAWANGTGRPVGPPGVPTNLTLSVGDGKLSLSWESPEDNGGTAVVGYDVEYRLSDGDDDWTSQGRVRTEDAVIRSLVNGLSYEVQVRTVNGVGESGWVTISGQPIGVPDPPSSAFLEIGDGQLTVWWTAPAVEGGSPVTGYLVEHRPAGTGRWTSLPGSSSPTVLTPLRNGTNYQVRIQAVNSQGASPTFDLTGTPLGRPTVPRNLRVAGGHKNLTVSWDPPENDSGLPITYEIEYQEGITPQRLNAVTSPTVITGLTNGTEYQVTVTASNRVGQSDGATGTGTPVGGAETPQNLTIVPSKAALTVSWDPPINTGLEVTGYRIEYRIAEGRWTVHLFANVRSTIITGLQIGETYQVRVRAQDSEGRLGDSALGQGVPLDGPSQPRSLRATIGNRKLTVRWYAPTSSGGAPLSTYIVQRRLSAHDPWTIVSSIPATAPPNALCRDITSRKCQDIPGLVNGVSYEVAVTAINDDVVYGDTATVTATPLGSSTPPQNLSVSTGLRTLRVSWEAPQNTGGYPVDNYKITISGGNLSSPLETYTAASVLSKRITNGIANGHTYRVEVLAITRSPNNRYYDGDPAAVDSAVVGPPNAPQNIEITVLGERETNGNDSGKTLKVTWEAPLAVQDEVTGYQVFWQKGSDDASTASVSGTEHTIYDLENSVEYTIWVTAVNSYTSSPPSDTVTGTPLTAGKQLEKWIDEELVPKYDNEFPWLRFTMDRWKRRGTTFVITEGGDGRAIFSWATNLTSTFAINIGEQSIRHEGVIIHELAHAYTMTDEDIPAGVGVAYLYLDQNYDHESCDLVELVADVLAVITTPDAWSGYWRDCDNLPSYPPADVRAIYATVAQLETPSWLVDNYQGGDGVWDKDEMETIWADLRELWSSSQRGLEVAALTRKSFSHVFGGYCETNPNLPIHHFLLIRDEVLNPWVDGGCVPDAPTGLRVVGGDGRLVVSWNEPAFSGGTAVSKYVVEWKTEGEDQHQEVLELSDLTRLRYVIENVTNYVDYTVTVTAVNQLFGGNLNEDGWGEPAEVIGRATGPDDVPGPPRNLELMAGEPDAIVQQLGTLVVSWQAPAHEGDSEITEYLVQWRKHDELYSDTQRQVRVTDLSELSIETPRLVEEEYFVRVRAVNSEGAGSPAEASSVVYQAPTLLKHFIEAEVVGAYEGTWPWLRVVWDSLIDNDATVRIGSYGDGRTGTVIRECDDHGRDRDPPLPRCWVDTISISQAAYRNVPELILVLARAYVVETTNQTGAPTPQIGIAHLYFRDLVRGGRNCETTTLLGETIASLIVSDFELWGWERCSVTGSVVTDEAKAVARDALAGNNPDWFATNYRGGDGIWDNADLEALWERILTEPRHPHRNVMVYLFRGLFGGYCEPILAVRTAAFASNPDRVRNPWKAGGCTPGEIRGLSAFPATRQIALRWEAPRYDGGASIAGYYIEWKSGTQEYDPDLRRHAHTDLGNLYHTILGLDNISHTVRVAAYNEAFDGPPTWVTVIAAPTNRPSQPRNLAIVEYGNAELIVSWEQPTTSGDTPITGYRVEYRQNGGEWALHGESIEAPTTITGLTNGLTYQIQVRAVTETRLGVPVVKEGTPGRPNAPVNVIVETGGSMETGRNRGGKLDVTWQEPTIGTPFTRYLVQWKRSYEEYDPDSRQDTTTELSHTISGLEDGVEYTVRVLAVNNHGQGIPSTEAAGTPWPSDHQLRDFIDLDVVGPYGADWEWIDLIWERWDSSLEETYA